jgi:hypothetical protein
MSDQPIDARPERSASPKVARIGRLIDAGAAYAALIYLACSLLFFGRGLVGHLRTRKIGIGADPSAFIWYLQWWPYAISHALNPLFTNLLWAPDGATLAWSTAIPLPAVAAWPLTHFLGPVAAFNLICLVGPPLAGFSAYLLCRWITGAFWPSLMGGFIFGFSPYMLGKMLGDVNLLMVFPLPLAVLVALEYYRGEIGASGHAIALAALLVVQFLCFPELLATMTLFAGFAFAVALIVIPERRRILTMLFPTGAGYGIAAVVLSPYLYEMLARRSPGREIYPLATYSADLANLVVPTATNLLGLIAPAQKISATFTGLIFENGACLTIPLIVIAEAWRRRHWNEPATKLAFLMLVIACVAMLGPDLHLLGHHTIAMPWALMEHLPFVAIALPVRYSVYAFLALAIITALWLAQATLRRGTKLAAAAIVVVFLLPNPSAGFWVSGVDTPELFRTGQWRQFISPGEIILPLPYARKGNSMMWQAAADMSFRMASGYTSVTPHQFSRLPIVNYLMGAIDLPEAADHLRAFIASKQVSAIVAVSSDPHFPQWQPVLDQLGIAPVTAGGTAIYRISPESFANYAALSGVALERRAVALRMDVLVEACAKYLALGKPIGALSPLVLKSADLLPATWAVSPHALALHDYDVIPVDGRVGIAMGGTYDALRPLAERYRALATRIDYPYPKAWSPDHIYPTGVIAQPMVFEFTPRELADAAAALKTSPPPERTTPFPAAIPSRTE